MGCGEEGEFVCRRCLEGFEFASVVACPACHKDNSTGEACSPCSPNITINRQISLAEYHESNLLGKIIKSLKYDFSEGLENSLFYLIKKQIEADKHFFNNYDMIVPVPLHSKRIAERGFNQALLIANLLSKEIGVPVSEALERIRYTKPQARFGREDRLINVKEAFSAVKNDSLSGKNIILVDDVYTTGATMNACAKALKLAGVERVMGWTLGRG